MNHSLLHRTFACFLAITLMTGTINNAVIMGEFMVNQDIIAKTLCVQKEAQKGCNGKCQLRSALAQTSTNINTDVPYQSNERTIALEIIVFVEAINATDLFSLKLKEPHQISIGIVQEIKSLYFDIETPPPVLG